MSQKTEKGRPPLTLKKAREEGRLAEFIAQHAEELAEDEEFQKLLERMEKDEKQRESGYKE